MRIVDFFCSDDIILIKQIKFKFMSFSLSILLFPYFLFLVAFFIFVFFNFYHLLRFGIRSLFSDFMVMMFCVGTFAILIASFLNIMQIDWSIIIEIF